MNSLSALVLGFAPGIFWLWFLYTRDRYHREPRSLVTRVFTLGMASTILVPILEIPLILLTQVDVSIINDLSEGSISELALLAFVIVGPAEELAKFLVVKAIVFKSPYFSESNDGFIYSAAAALGFASVENVTYAIQFGPEVMLFRGPISTLVHVMLGALWGYGLVKYKTNGRKALPFLWFMLVLSAGLHGLFDFLLFTQATTGSRYWLLAFVMFGVGLAIYWWTLQKTQKVSLKNLRVATALRQCIHCNSYVGANSRFCPNCGNHLDSDTQTLTCANCQNTVTPGSKYCGSCGYQLIKQ